jgi:hypothetical protein
MNAKTDVGATRMVQAQSLVHGCELKEILAKMTLQEAIWCHDFETLGGRYGHFVQETGGPPRGARAAVLSPNLNFSDSKPTQKRDVDARREKDSRYFVRLVKKPIITVSQERLPTDQTQITDRPRSASEPPGDRTHPNTHSQGQSHRPGKI